MPLETHAFGTLADGREARLIELHNGNGMSVGVTDLGASLVSVRVPDRRGGRPDVTLGFDGAVWAYVVSMATLFVLLVVQYVLLRMCR